MIKSNRRIARSDIDTLDLETRVQLEAQITDARSEVIDFERFQQIDTDLAHYAASTPWWTYLFNFLGPVAGKTILDVACGYSMTPVILASAGATVHAIDVAPKTVATVQQFAQYKGVGKRVFARVSPAEELAYADETFDLIFGGAALHHLQLERAAVEFRRVLKPGGRAAFQDPLGHNLLLEFARDYLPYKDKHPVKGTDRPLQVSDIETFGRYFASYTWRGFDLVAMARKPFHLKKQSPVRKALYGIDNALFTMAPFLQRYARFAVTCVTK